MQTETFAFPTVTALIERDNGREIEILIQINSFNLGILDLYFKSTLSGSYSSS